MDDTLVLPYQSCVNGIQPASLYVAHSHSYITPIIGRALTCSVIFVHNQSSLYHQYTTHTIYTCTHLSCMHACYTYMSYLWGESTLIVCICNSCMYWCIKMLTFYSLTARVSLSSHPLPLSHLLYAMYTCMFAMNSQSTRASTGNYNECAAAGAVMLQHHDPAIHNINNTHTCHIHMPMHSNNNTDTNSSECISGECMVSIISDSITASSVDGRSMWVRYTHYPYPYHVLYMHMMMI